VDVRLPDLPDALKSLTIVQLCDFHAGPHISATDVRRSVEMANALGADLIVLTGDFVYGSASYALDCAQELAALRARHGVFAVLGNHDIWTNADEVAASLSRAGIWVLRNEPVLLTPGGADLWLLGIEDTGYAGKSFSDFTAIWEQAALDLARMLETIPAGAPRILLVHNPDFAEMLPEGRIDLVLCGHTHGGQVRVPILGAPIVPSCFGQKYAGGLVAGPRTVVYVNRGIGLIAPPVRFNCRPEITLFRLSPG
jgi:predicted MPP superfamily phosphohydrolase